MMGSLFYALVLLGVGLWLRPYWERFWFIESGAKYFGDLLTYSHLVEEGVVMLDDGRLLGVLRINPPDATATDEDQLRAIRAVVQGLLLRQPGYTFQFDVVRGPSEEPVGATDFPTETLRAVWDARCERQREDAPYISRVFLTITSPLLKRPFLKDLVKPSDGLPDDGAIRGFKGLLDVVASSLGHDLSPKVMSSDEVLTFLRETVGGDESKVGEPWSPEMRLAGFIGDQDVIGGEAIRVGGMHTGVVSFSMIQADMPSDPQAFMFETDGRIRSSVAVKIWQRSKADRYFGKMKTSALSGARGLLSKVIKDFRKDKSAIGDVDRETAERVQMNAGSVASADEFQNAEKHLFSGEDCFGEMMWTVVVQGRTRQEMEETRARVVAKIQLMRCTCVVESAGALAALHGSLPGHFGNQVRRMVFSGSGVARIAPLLAPWEGTRTVKAEPALPEGTPTVMRVRVRDPNTRGRGMAFHLTNMVGDVGHAAVFGPTGAGKSVFLAVFMSFFLQYPKSRVFVIDKGRSALPFARISGGNHYPLDLDGNGCSLSALDGLTRGGNQGLASAVHWCKTVAELRGVKVDTSMVTILENTLAMLQKQEDPEMHRLSALVNALQGPLHDALRPYAAGGIYGKLFDGEMPDLGARVNVFELDSVMRLPEEVKVPAMQLIFDAVALAADPSVPTLFAVDEAHNLVKHPEAAKRLDQHAREYRKLRVFMMLLTQALGDLVKGHFGAIFQETVLTQIHLPKVDAMSPNLDAVYKAANVPRNVRREIAGAVAKMQYVIMQKRSARVFDLDLSPMELEVLTGANGGLQQWEKAVERMGERAAIESWGDWS